ncbi:serine/threonine protein kinase [Solimonas marina]|uniref:Protein kinase domain-containing protein n=1 Tax=Solimonas marina TaxID=2714601 RepID=A0A969WA00_9GAMM|nr:hypothetical protein [Solimonas marina]NKF21060.1 hypothetical protein [Solimonas marina]
MDAVSCAPLPAGARVGRWQITDTIGRTPYLCRYLAHDGQSQAILHELLPDSLIVRGEGGVQTRDAEDRNTFRWWLRGYLDRANAFAALPAPGFASVLDAFEAGGTAYVAFEALAGETLAEHVRANGALDWRQYLPAMRPLIEALMQAHARNLVVRDIVPAQLVLRPGGGLALASFGPLRAPVRFRAMTVTSTTQAAYAAPEALSAIGQIGAWTDAYALGASCAYALYGRVPPEAARSGGTPLSFALTDALPPPARSALEGLLLTDAGARTTLPALLAVLPHRVETTAPAAAPSPRARLAFAAIGSVAIAGLAAALWLRPEAPEPEAAAAPTTIASDTAPTAQRSAASPAAGSEHAIPATAPAANDGAQPQLALIFGKDDEAKPAAPAKEPAARPAPAPRPAAVSAPPASPPSPAPARPDPYAPAPAQLSVTVNTPTLNVEEAPAPVPKPVVDPAVERARIAAAHTAELRAEKMACNSRRHISQYIVGGSVTYDDLSKMKNVDRLNGGQLALRHVPTDDGRSVSLFVDIHGCVISIRSD